MLAFLFIQQAISIPIYGNYTQKYYYVELENKEWILDNYFDGAIEQTSCNEQQNFNEKLIVMAQRFIYIISIPQTDRLTDNQSPIYIIKDNKTVINGKYQNIQIENYSIQKYCAIYYLYEQEINNYLGLSRITLNYSSPQKLKLCLAQNGGYLKIGDFQNDEEHIKIPQDCFQQSYCYFLLKEIVVKGSKLVPVLEEQIAEVDFSSSYVFFPFYLYSIIIEQIQCQGLLCPNRNDQDGLICYDNDYDNLDDFYSKFPTILFKFQDANDYYWFSQDYLVTSDNKTYCIPIKRGRESTILGQPFMRNKEFIFGKKYITVNYQNCNEETSLDTPTQTSLNYQIKELSQQFIGIVKRYKLITDQSTYLMILLLFSIVHSQLIFNLARDRQQSEYYIQLEIGTPKEPIFAIVDTGASRTQLKCNKNSSSLDLCVDSLFCTFQSATYDGEWSNIQIATEIFHFGEKTFKMPFGQILNDGSNLIGLGNNNTFVQSLYKEFDLDQQNQVFSLLLTDLKGTLTIGQNYPNEDELGIPLNENSAYYNIDIENVTDDQNNLVFQFNVSDDYEIIIDSGSTLINMDADTLSYFMKSFTKCKSDPRGCPQKINYYGQECYSYDKSRYGDISNFFGTFPELNFNFKNGYTYNLNPKNYLLYQLFNPNIYCLPFNDFTRNYEPKFKKIILLGQPFMKNKEFYFDLTQQKVFIKSPEEQQQSFFQYSDWSFQFYIILEVCLLIGICYFCRKHSAQIRSMFRFNRADSGPMPYH